MKHIFHMRLLIFQRNVEVYLGNIRMICLWENTFFMNDKLYFEQWSMCVQVVVCKNDKKGEFGQIVGCVGCGWANYGQFWKPNMLICDIAIIISNMIYGQTLLT